MKRYGNELDTDPQTKKSKPVQEPSRSVHIGNIHPETSYYDICSVANKYGAIEFVKITPKKMCAFLNYVTQDSAEGFVAECQTNPFVTFGKTARVGWAKAVEMKDELKGAIDNEGATRNLFIGNVNNRPPNVVNEDMLSQVFSKFGEIENVVLKPEKAIAFVNMTSITAAKKAMMKSESEGIEVSGRKLKVAYATEGKRARDPRQLVQQPQQQQPYPATGAPHIPNTRGGKMDGPGSRAVFLGNLPPETTYKDIFRIANNHGPVDWAKLNVEKKNAFINFVRDEGASSLVRSGQSKAFNINKHPITANYAKATPILPEVQQFLMEGATRNLFVAGIGETTTEEDVQALFQPFCKGEFDSISILPAKKIAFVNMTSVRMAAHAKNTITQQITSGNAPVLGGVAIAKINYAKEHKLSRPIPAGPAVTAPVPTYDPRYEDDSSSYAAQYATSSTSPNQPDPSTYQYY